MTESLKEVIIRRDGLTEEQADVLISEARERIYSGDDLGEVLQEEFGLEEDYIFDLLY